MVAIKPNCPDKSLLQLHAAPLFDHSPNPVFIFTSKGIICWVNKAAKRLTGLTNATLEHTINGIDLVDKEYKEIARLELSKAHTQHEPRHCVRLKITNIRSKVGKLVDFHYLGWFPGPHRKQRLLLVIGDPISKAEINETQTLSLLEESVFDHAGIGITLFGPNNELIRANPAMQQFLGYTEKEIQRLGIQGITFPEDFVMGSVYYKELVEGRRDAYQVDKRYIRKDGVIVWGRLHSSLIRDEAGKMKYGIGIIEDITHEKQLEEKRGNFLSTAAHELKTPLASSKLALQTLLTWHRKIKKIPIPIQRLANLLSNEFSRLERIIEDILDAQRLETGKLSIQKTQFDITELLREIIEEILLIHPDYQISFTRKQRMMATGDPERIDQVVVNLLSNALKHAHGNEVEVLISKRQTHVIVSVVDHGKGIDKKSKSRVFEKFYQSNTVKGGFGLGLYLSKQLIELHGGKIWVKDTPGGGATFCFSLPAK